ncbi:MAG TPA: hypothetical protein VLY83_06255 [Methanoregula sp.]|nr:hypothetical protein [Methanoregula sp.]
MDKKDILSVAAALGIILVVAVVVKPIMTGHPVNTGVATPPTTVPPVSAAPTPDPALGGALPPTPTSATAPPPTTIPTPVPTANLSVQSVAFVDPSTYHVSLNNDIPNGTPIYTVQANNSLSTIATISGQYSGTTQVIRIPYPYWELWYTAEPSGDVGGQKQSLSSSTVKGSTQSGEKGSGSSQTFIQGSFSVTFPTLSIQVMDANDPNRIVRTIEPPGGLDKNLWTTTDPRPWSEKFYEGQQSYYFIINAHELDSYEIDVKVPSRYLGKY